MKSQYGVLILSAISVIVSGCATYQQRSAMGTRTVPQKTPAQLASERRDAKLFQLESEMVRLRGETDSMSTSLNGFANQINAFTNQSDARSTDIVTLKQEIDALRRQLVDVQSKVDAIPQSISTLLASHDKSLMAEVNKVIDAKVSAIRTSLRSSSGSRRSSSGRYYEHVVETGQTVSEIANAYKVSVSDIVAENNLKSAATIRVGQKLLIPAP